jgi:transposase-like protein
MNIETDFKIFEKLKAIGLVEPLQLCSRDNCKMKGRQMFLKNRKRDKNSTNLLLTWYCNGCKSYKSVYDGSFFSLFRKPIRILLGIIKCWSAHLTISKTVSTIKLHLNEDIHRDSVASLFHKLRQICSLDIDRKSLKLGGPGKIIEIDESLYAKVKHSKGKDLIRPQVWTFGLVQRKDSQSNGKCYFEVVPNREATTLLAIIYEKVASGSTIYSDCWSSYEKISKLGFQHHTVNHTYNFLDPDTGSYIYYLLKLLIKINILPICVKVLAPIE